MIFIQTVAVPVGLSLALVAGAALAQNGPHAPPANVV